MLHKNEFSHNSTVMGDLSAAKEEENHKKLLWLHVGRGVVKKVLFQQNHVSCGLFSC